MAKTGKQKQPAPFEKRLMQASELIRQGRSNEVLHGLVEMGKRKPKDFRIFDLLCSANASMGRHAEAIEAGRRAVGLNPKVAPTRMRFAKALAGGGEYEEAVEEYERAMYWDPTNLDLIRGKLNVYTDLGDHEKALATLREMEGMIAKQGHDPMKMIGVSLDKARLSPKTLPAQEVIDELVPLAENEENPDGFRVIAHHHVGRLYETLKEYDLAMEHWGKGNVIKIPEWDCDMYSRYIDRLIKCWEKIEKVPVADTAIAKDVGSRLIIVTGMMRSGTSLTEQMISQIPGVTPGGEMNAVARCVLPYESLPNPWGGRALPVTRLIYNQRVINEMSKAAGKMYAEAAPEGWLTDKQPYNVPYVPMITRLFPGAKIVHCCRDAQDCCLSNYMQTFARSHPQTHDLYRMGRYHADYQRMMAAWHELDEVEMLDLHYEKVVSEPEAESRRVCDFLGVEWAESILNFHKSERTVRTASRDQVRKPLYKSSVKKYERYESHLGELRRGLAEGLGSGG